MITFEINTTASDDLSQCVIEAYNFCCTVLTAFTSIICSAVFSSEGVSEGFPEELAEVEIVSEISDAVVVGAGVDDEEEDVDTEASSFISIPE